MSEALEGTVDSLLTARAHPFTAVIEAARAELLAPPGVIESVKWNAPNYSLDDDFATMNLRDDAAVQIILHTGAKVKPEHPEIAIEPRPSFAKWASRNRMIVSFRVAVLDSADVAELARIIRSWTSQLV